MIFRPERGWDPVPKDYALRYAQRCYDDFHAVSATLEDVENYVGSLDGLSVLDIGGGPGQFSVAMAERGANVVWYDISQNYLDIARARAESRQVEVEFSLGYFDEAASVLRERRFGLIFCRVCWYYCQDDRRFADLIGKLLAPDGVVYVEFLTPLFEGQMSMLRRLLYFVYQSFGWKIGHLHPTPKSLIVALMRLRPLRFEFVQTRPESAIIVCRVPNDR